MVGFVSSVRTIYTGPAATSFASGANETRHVAGGANAASGVEETSFAQTMADVLTDTAADLKSAEAASISAVRGEASAQQVVEAVMEAEMSLKTALAIRDKVVSAYQEFSRMTI